MEISRFELSHKFCMYNGVCLLDRSETVLVFGLLDMDNEPLKEKLRKAVLRIDGRAGCEFVKVSLEELESAVGRIYGKSDIKDDVKNDGSRSAASILLDSLICDGRRRGATDIHIEENVVRFRIFGLLENVCELTAEKSSEIVRRVKALAKLNVMERRLGQDGHFVVDGESPLFVRVSCVPSVSSFKGGLSESVVLRLLDPERVPLNFGALGFDYRQQQSLSEFAWLESGLVLLCGPTGSGKSTTAASILKFISDSEKGARKIISIEDPPEYVLDGVTQIPVSKQVDFNNALKLVFRQDPDVIFIGEIRDQKSAAIALQASLSGHLVFATLHTDSLEELFMRISELGIAESELRCALRGCVIQKLIHFERRIKLEAQVHVFKKQTEAFRRVSTWKTKKLEKEKSAV